MNPLFKMKRNVTVMVKYAHPLLLFVLISLSSTVEASEFSVGGAVAAGNFGYKETNAKILPFPLVNYEYGDFYVHALNAGYYVFRDGENDVALTIGPGALSYEPSDSNNDRMRKLNKRKISVMSGIMMNNRFRWGTFRTSVSSDVSDNSRGTVVDAAYLYPIRSGKVIVTPGFGVNWSDSQFNRYYYGISPSEARRSGMAQYTPGEALTFYMEMSAFYQVNKSWFLMSSIRVTDLNSTVTESDMVSGGISTQFIAGFGYAF
ncbi:MipA/OmpV family protein [Salmonella enterica subsp. enterica]|nr:MipA/OmpV family protein [Salmonella enterica subsp. enterica]EAY8717988.1 MipA/OmpV family protein [Salmonella enterica]